MEGDPKGIGVTTEVKRSLLPSREAWATVIREGNIGTGIFPQAFLASGIRVARSIAIAANTEGLPLPVFLNTDPPKELVVASVGKSRIKAHAAFNIETGKAPPPKSLANVWEKDITKASEIIRNFADIVSGVYPGGELPEDIALLEQMQTDPRFLMMLNAAFRGLMEPSVIATSHEYKKKLAAFMEKYAPYIGKTEYPSEYKYDQQQINHQLYTDLASAGSMIRNSLQTQMVDTFLDEIPLIERLSEASDEQIFGTIAVATVDPLRTTDE